MYSCSLQQQKTLMCSCSLQQKKTLCVQEFLEPVKRLLVLTGAGISTESGIPDYRGEGVGLYATSDKRPMQHKTFMESAKARKSYWAR